MPDVKYAVLEQGSPVISSAYYIEKKPTIVAIEIDLRSKYCEVSASGSDSSGPFLAISACKESIKLNELVERDAETIISLPEFVGWETFSISVARYSVKICLIKED
jgi:hypothetical protein